MSPLHVAVEGGHIKIVEYLTDQQDIHVNAEDKNGVNMNITHLVEKYCCVDLSYVVLIPVRCCI